MPFRWCSVNLSTHSTRTLFDEEFNDAHVTYYWGAWSITEKNKFQCKKLSGQRPYPEHISAERTLRWWGATWRSSWLRRNSSPAKNPPAKAATIPTATTRQQQHYSLKNVCPRPLPIPEYSTTRPPNATSKAQFWIALPPCNYSFPAWRTWTSSTSLTPPVKEITTTVTRHISSFGL